MSAPYRKTPAKSKSFQKGSVSCELRIPLEVLGDPNLSKDVRVFLLQFLYPTHVNKMPSTRVAELFSDISKEEVKNIRSRLKKKGRITSYKVPVAGSNPYTYHKAVVSKEGTKLNLAALNDKETRWAFYSDVHGGDDVAAPEGAEASDATDHAQQPVPASPPAPAPEPALESPTMTAKPAAAVVDPKKLLQQKVLSTMRAATKEFDADRSTTTGTGGLTTASVAFLDVLLTSLKSWTEEDEATLINILLDAEGGSYEVFVTKGVFSIVNTMSPSAQSGALIAALKAGLPPDHDVLGDAFYEPPPPPPPPPPVGSDVDPAIWEMWGNESFVDGLGVSMSYRAFYEERLTSYGGNGIRLKMAYNAVANLWNLTHVNNQLPVR